MSITSFMYTGVSGLRSQSDAMSIISDNIANVNTVGFKASRANFGEILGGQIAGDAVGAGSVVSNVQTLFTQGSLLGTGNATDLALRGEGFFIVAEPGQTGAPMYTRAGQFELDATGFLVDQGANQVQGYTVDSAGVLSSQLGSIQVASTSLAPVATASVSMDANLNAEVVEDGIPFDITDPNTTSDFVGSVTVYDSLGQPHNLEVFFKKLQTAPTPQWEVNVAVASSEVDPPGAGSRVLLGTGTMDFGVDGSLTSNTLTNVNVQWAGAAAAAIQLDFGTPTALGGTGADGIATYASESAMSYVSQDGNSSGDLGGLQITDDGTITGLYTNGETRTLGQIATARFTANSGLTKRGDGLYSATDDAGEPIVGAPGSGGHGSVVSGTLEASNVDLANEFVTMIAVQRGFQANSRSITTADEMLSEVVSLKR